MKQISQGKRANQHGQDAEQIVASVVYQCWPHARIESHARVGRTVYGRSLEADIHVSGLENYPTGLAIEVKWQDSNGTVDEKFPYLIANIRSGYPCPVLVVTGGKGARPDAIHWLRDQVDGIHLIAVLTLEEFITWCHRNV